MSHLLRDRYDGKPVSPDDENVVALAVQRLNARIVHEYASKPTKRIKNQALSGRRLLGHGAVSGIHAATSRQAEAMSA